MTAFEQAERALDEYHKYLANRPDSDETKQFRSDLADALAKAAQAVAETHGEDGKRPPPYRQTMEALDAALRRLGIGEDAP